MSRKHNVNVVSTEELLTTAEASAYLAERGLNIKPTEIARMAAAGTLLGAQKAKGGAWRIPKSGLNPLLQRKSTPKRWKWLAAVAVVGLPLLFAAPSCIKDGLELFEQSFENNLTIDVRLRKKEAVRIEGQLAADEPVEDPFYTDELSPDLLTISPIMSFGQLVSEDNGEPYTVKFPELDIKITNDSNTTKFISQVRVDVASSKPDLRPVPKIVKGDKAGEFYLNNEGWGAMLDGKLRLKAEAGGETAEFDFKEIKYRKAFTCAPFVKAAGGNPVLYASIAHSFVSEENDAKWKSAVGPRLIDEKFGRPEVFVPTRAEAIFRYVDADGKHQNMSVNFETTMVLSADEGGYGLGGIEGTAQILLKDSGKDYSVDCPISIPLKAKDVCRLSVRVGAPKSSNHEFKIKLICSDGTVIEPKTSVRVQIHLTKLGLAYIEEGEESDDSG